MPRHFSYKILALSKPQAVKPSLDTIKTTRRACLSFVLKTHKQPLLWLIDDRHAALSLEQDLIADAMTYFELKNTPAGYSFLTLPEAEKDRIFADFRVRLGHHRLTFQSVLTYLEKQMQVAPEHQIKPEDFFHNHDQLAEAKTLKTGIELFLNRGKYHWQGLLGSHFQQDFLEKPDVETLADDARINCWEAILYAMIRSGALDRNTVRFVYSAGRTKRGICQALSTCFGWQTAPQLPAPALWQQKKTESAYIIMSSENNVWSPADGLDHDMISLPWSSEKLLQFMLQLSFSNSEKTGSSTYSHWTHWTDARLGKINPSDFNHFSKSFTIRIIPFSDFITRFNKEAENLQYEDSCSE